MKIMKNESIQDYILKSERNLGVATAVGEAWPEARQKLVSSFLDRLESRLKKKLKNWKCGRYGQFFAESDTGFYLLKAAWENQYSIGLQFRDHGEHMVIGVVREVPYIGKRQFCVELAEAFKKIHPSATTHQWWEARSPLRSPATDWRKPEVLWRMHTEKQFLVEVAEQLLAVAKISEPIIDKLVRKYRK